MVLGLHDNQCSCNFAANHSTMKLFITTALALFTTLAVSAQSKDSVLARSHWYFGIGGGHQTFTNINKRIAPMSQFEQLKGPQLAGTLGILSQEGRFMSDISLNFFSQLKGDDEKKSSSAAGISANLNYGYNLLPASKSIRLYPMLGVGFEYIRTSFNKDLSGVAFDSVLTSPNWRLQTEPVTFSNTYFTYNATLAIDFLNKKTGNSFVGFRAGYTGSFKSRTWRANDNQLLANAPSDRVNRWYLMLTLGMGKSKNVKR